MLSQPSNEIYNSCFAFPLRLCFLRHVGILSSSTCSFCLQVLSHPLCQTFSLTDQSGRCKQLIYCRPIGQPAQVKQVVGPAGSVRRSWYLLGKRMSPKCVVACLALSNSRVARVSSGRKDRRYRLWGGVHRFNSDCITFVSLFPLYKCKENLSLFGHPCLFYLALLLAEGNKKCPKKKMSVDRFLLDLYIKAAGMLPQKFLGIFLYLTVSCQNWWSFNNTIDNLVFFDVRSCCGYKPFLMICCGTQGLKTGCRIPELHVIS